MNDERSRKEDESSRSGHSGNAYVEEVVENWNEWYRVLNASSFRILRDTNYHESWCFAAPQILGRIAVNKKIAQKCAKAKLN
jgi:hypothetical protein